MKAETNDFLEFMAVIFMVYLVVLF